MQMADHCGIRMVLPGEKRMTRRILSPFVLGCLNAFGATVFWSGNFVVARGLAGQLTPVEISFWRWGLAFLMILPFTVKSVWAHRGILRAHWPSYLCLGLFGVSLINTLNYKAGITTGATNIALIATSAPMFMALISCVFLRDRLSRQQSVGLVIALIGVVVLVTRGSLEALLGLTFTEGDLWALLGAVAFAIYTIQLRFRPGGMPPVAFLTVIFGIGTFGLAPFLGWGIWGGEGHWPSLPQFGCLVYIALFASVVGFLFWNKAIDLIGPVRSGVIYYSIPLFSSIEAALLLGEGISLSQMLGGVLIIGGILFSTLDTLRRADRTSA